MPRFAGGISPSIAGSFQTQEKDTIMRSTTRSRATTATNSRATRAFALSLLLAGGSIMLVGCNTMEGLGKDTQAAGEALENEAKD